MRIALALIPLMFALPATADNPAADSCVNVRVALPPELAGWSEAVPVTAGVKPGDGGAVSPGKAALITLHPAGHLALAPTAKPSTGNGGSLRLTISEAGSYRVALGDKAWVDLVQEGKAIASHSHGHGPRCSGVRKLVDFKLAPGKYTIQLSGSAAESIALLVAKIA